MDESAFGKSHPWDGYLVGPENALAHAAVRGLVLRDEAAASPVVVYGPRGVGKSHLLAGLVEEWLRRHPGATIAHFRGGDFLALFDGGAGGGTVEDRLAIRDVGLFVLDDLQQVGKSVRALEALIHVLDAFEGTGAAVAAASIPGPLEWLSRLRGEGYAGCASRLMDRFQRGLIASIETPGLALRRRYVLEHAPRMGLTLSAEALELVAERLRGFADMKGFLGRLGMEGRWRRATGSQAIGRGLVEELLGLATGEAGEGASILVNTIVRRVCRHFGVAPGDLRGPARHAGLIVPRHLAMWMIRQRTSLSLAAIGRHFDGRDAQTVRHACEMTERGRIAADSALQRAVDRIGLELGGD